MTTVSTPALLNLKQVCAITTLGKSSIYKLIKAGQFPAAIRIPHTHRTAWPAGAVHAVVASWVHQQSGN